MHTTRIRWPYYCTFRAATTPDLGIRFESGVIAQAGDSSTSVREAWDTSQVTRAVDLARTDAKGAFEVANAISTQHMRDIALASILPRYSEIDSERSMTTVRELQKHLDSMP